MEERKLKSECFSAEHQGDSYTAEAQSRTGDLGYCGSGFSVQSGGYKRAAQRLLWLNQLLCVTISQVCHSPRAKKHTSSALRTYNKRRTAREVCGGRAGTGQGCVLRPCLLIYWLHWLSKLLYSSQTRQTDRIEGEFEKHANAKAMLNGHWHPVIFLSNKPDSSKPHFCFFTEEFCGISKLVKVT